MSLTVKTDDVTKGRKDLDPHGRLRAVTGGSGANGLRVPGSQRHVPTEKFLKYPPPSPPPGTCSGLKVNHEKTELLLLGNLACTGQETAVNNIKIKQSVNIILGVHFTHDIRAKQKLNINEVISSTQLKLRIWRWRDLIIGRIQIVKTFIIPIFLYRTSLISLDKEFVKEANKIIFDFVWKGKDKVKRSALISDIEDDKLKAPHLNSIIETQGVLCCKT